MFSHRQRVNQENCDRTREVERRREMGGGKEGEFIDRRDDLHVGTRCVGSHLDNFIALLSSC